MQFDKSTALLTAAIMATAGFFSATGPVAARKLHRAPAPYEYSGRSVATETPRSFYPEEIEGGVSGNLPFNNQIRKMRDPLNANGAGR